MKNEYRVEGNVVTMEVQGQQAIFDWADLPAVDRFGSWKISRGASVYADYRDVEHKMCKITLHKLLTDSTWVKWLNGNTFDFRRSNLSPIEKQIRARHYGGRSFTPNEHRIEGDIVAIQVRSKTEEAVAYVDLEDYPAVSGYRWNLNPVSGYVQTVKREGKSDNHYYIHRLIMGVKEYSIQVDHINGIKLDNRKENLRLCGQSQNNHNSGRHREGTTGVSKTWDGYWNAHLKIGEVMHRKTFKVRDDAVAQYKVWRDEFNPSGLGAQCPNSTLPI